VESLGGPIRPSLLGPDYRATARSGQTAALRPLAKEAAGLSGPSVIVARVPYAEIRLGNGDVYTVEGTLDEVEKSLSDAARSGQARLAWFKQRTDGAIGINPAQVAALRASETSD